jgi:shikimate dehydrogenase
VPPERIREALRALPALGFAGSNVTVPHKEAALDAVDHVDPLARRIGAVNTIVVGADGTLSGSNTDGFGFFESVRPALNDALLARPAVVVGAGGAARAVCVALLDAGVPSLRLTNRTAARADALADALGGPVDVAPWDGRDSALADAGILVNTTTLGMEGAGALDLDLAALPTDALVTDIVYTPLVTPLLAAAAARGNPTVDGLNMLLHQARPGFAAWFGVEPEVTEGLRDFVLEDLT